MALDAAQVMASYFANPDEHTDADLLERFVAYRDGEAFALLVRRHGPMVLGVCRRVLRHTQDVEDAFQATFLVLARRAAAVRWRESAGGWLYEVAHRVADRARCQAAGPREAGDGRASHTHRRGGTEGGLARPAARGAAPPSREVPPPGRALLPGGKVAHRCGGGAGLAGRHREGPAGAGAGLTPP